ncbi:MAG: S8 family serine peptidase [Actinomycetes bacterium]
MKPSSLVAGLVAGVMTMAISAGATVLLPVAPVLLAGANATERLASPPLRTEAPHRTNSQTLSRVPRWSGPVASEVSRGRLLVKLTRTANARTSASSILARVGEQSRPLGGRWFSIRGVADAATARTRLSDAPGVVAVQRDHLRQAFGDQYYRRYQPYLRASMDVNAAWHHSSGRGVTVAVLDTGVDATHEDLTHVLRGRDFVDGDRKTQDPVGHGTFVAGVIAAQRDNQKGIAGVSRASILPVRVLNAKGYGRDATIARAIRWATNQDADIINLSLGGAQSGRILRDAVKYAHNHGVLVVASAGNDGGTKPRYPAAFSDAVAVGATDWRDRMVWWSQHGSWVDLVAPGVKIASTVPDDHYAIGSGTSFSAPLVSGAAALLLSKHPSWSVGELHNALLQGAADAGPVGPDAFTGLGVPDVDGMVGGAAKSAVELTGPSTGTSPGNARVLQKDSVVPASSPEGTDRWFRLDVSSPTRITVSGRGGNDGPATLRGDLELALFDSSYGRLDLGDAASGLRAEQVSAVVDDTVYLRVRNLEDTRWPDAINLGFSRTAANPAHVATGGAPRPVMITSSPLQESYGADGAQAIQLTTGVNIRTTSINQASIQLLDGESGGAVPIDVAATVDGWQVTPLAPLDAARAYALVLDGLRTTGGSGVPYTRVGFRTAS